MRRPVGEFAFPAPIGGLVRQGLQLGGAPTDCEVLDNFIPTAEGARLRGGSSLFATVAARVVSLFVHRGGSAETFFAATATAIYNITSVADPAVSPSADLTGLGSGDWSDTQFATAGGQFLVIANGVTAVRHFNGSVWATPTITGVTSSTLNFVWPHKRRLWFIQGGTLSAWYLPVNSIAGAATEFPLAGVFRKGGRLVMGGTLSSDAGDGIDDYAVFITSEGEVAMYQGTDPGSSFALVGVYQIGRPLNKKAFFRSGGDFIVLTEDGIVPLSAAVSANEAGLQVNALSAPIENLWQEVVADRVAASGFSVEVWPTKTLFMVAVPRPGGGESALVANTRTGRWGRILDWDVQAQAIFADHLYFADSAGRIIKADVGGNDMGEPYSGVVVPKFQELGTPSEKAALHLRVIYKSPVLSRPALACFANYQVDQYPTAGSGQERAFDVWGTGVWGTFVWGASDVPIVQNEWQAVSAWGFSLAPCLVVSSNAVLAPNFELVALVLRYEAGAGL